MAVQKLIDSLKLKLQPVIDFAQENKAIAIVVACIVVFTLLVLSFSIIRALSNSSDNTEDSSLSISPTPNVSPTTSVSPSPTASGSATPTRKPSPSVSTSPTVTKKPTTAPTATDRPAATATPRPNPTNTPVAQPSNTPTSTPTITPTVTLSPTPRPVVNFAPSPLDFGAVAQGTVVQKTITISNQGPGDLIISGTSISHADVGACGSAFIVQYNGGSIAAGGVAGMPVDFAPSSNGCNWSATLTVTSNAAGSPHTIAITGSGTSN